MQLQIALLFLSTAFFVFSTCLEMGMTLTTQWINHAHQIAWFIHWVDAAVRAVEQGAQKWD